jgi:hypothetical protein
MPAGRIRMLSVTTMSPMDRRPDMGTPLSIPAVAQSRPPGLSAGLRRGMVRGRIDFFHPTPWGNLQALRSWCGSSGPP